MEIHRLVADISAKEEEIVENACKIDKRSKASLIRKAVLDYAKEIVQNEKTNRIQ